MDESSGEKVKKNSGTHSKNRIIKKHAAKANSAGNTEKQGSTTDFLLVSEKEINPSVSVFREYDRYCKKYWAKKGAFLDRIR